MVYTVIAMLREKYLVDTPFFVGRTVKLCQNYNFTVSMLYNIHMIISIFVMNLLKLWMKIDYKQFIHNEYVWAYLASFHI